MEAVISRRNRSSDPECAPDSDRRRITGWVYACSILVGIWVLAPMVTRLVALAAGSDVRLTLSRPDGLAGPDGVELRGLAADVPVDQLGSGARTAILVGTVVELLVVFTMLIVVTVVMRSMRPGGELRNGTRIIAISVVVVAGLIGLVGSHVFTSAGPLACQDLYGACSAGRTWDDPMTNAFPLAGIALGLMIALVRSETAARRSTEGLV